jgi:outer membrane protein assembly factor BamD (BamD/ComL family)
LTLVGELDLLKRARAALRSGDTRQALALLDTHARERGGSELIAEATLLRIEALSALGERVTASDLARRFVHDSPHSALSDRAKSFISADTPHAP